LISVNHQPGKFSKSRSSDPESKVDYRQVDQADLPVVSSTRSAALLANTTHVEYPSVNLASREFKADPFPFYARLRAELPVCRVTVPLMPGINEA
jgi:hypothetical protein